MSEECVSKGGGVWKGLNWNSGFLANHKEGWKSQAMFLSQVPLSSPPPGSLGHLMSSLTPVFSGC